MKVIHFPEWGGVHNHQVCNQMLSLMALFDNYLLVISFYIIILPCSKPFFIKIINNGQHTQYLQ